MRGIFKLAFVVLSALFLSALPLVSATESISKESLEKWKNEILLYLPEVLLGKVNKTSISFSKEIVEKSANEYEYFLVGDWGAGTATIYVVDGKGVLIKYNLAVSLPRIANLTVNFLKSSLGINANITGGRDQNIVAEVYPGTKLFGNAIEIPLYSWWLARVPGTNLTINRSVQIGKVSVLLIDGSPVFCAVHLHPYISFPPVWIRNSYLVNICQRIFTSFLGKFPWKNESVTSFDEEKDLLGELGGSIIINTQGRTKIKGDVSIGLNAWGQIIRGGMGKSIMVNKSYFEKHGGMDNTLKTILGRDYLSFLSLLANYSNNPQFKSFISDLSKIGYGEYLGIEYSSFLLKMQSSSSTHCSYRYLIRSVDQNVTQTIGLSFGEIDALEAKNGSYGILEDGGISLLKFPSISLEKEAPKVSAKEVRSELSKLLKGNYSIEDIHLHYVPRVTKEAPEYVANCTSSICHLTITASGIDGKILDISYQIQREQTHGGLPKISHKEGVMIIEIGVAVAVAIGGISLALLWRRRKKLGL